MSLEQVKKIIDQALADEAFYAILMKQPESIFKDHELNEAEQTMIRNLAKSPYTQARKGLMDTERLVVAALHYTPGTLKKS